MHVGSVFFYDFVVHISTKLKNMQVRNFERKKTWQLSMEEYVRRLMNVNVCSTCICVSFLNHICFIITK